MSYQQSEVQNIGEVLLKLNLITADQLEVAILEKKEEEGTSLPEIIVKMGFVTEEQLGKVVSENMGIKKVDLQSMVLDSRLVKKIPKKSALKYFVIPVAISKKRITIATPNVFDMSIIDKMRQYFPSEFELSFVYTPKGDLLEAVDHYYDYEMSMDDIVKEIGEGEEAVESSFDGTEEGYTNPMVRLVDAILVDAVHQGASDIHLEPEGSFVRLRYRVDGKLMQIRTFHKTLWSAISVRIKIISDMNIAESRKPQDGRISTNILGREIDFRVATQPTVHGENVVLRTLDKRKSLMPFDKLGFTESNEKLLKKMLKRPEGIIVVTGPTGSGKTTTLYSVLSYINSIDINIMTLEDPVEYQLPLIRQSNIQEKSGMGFAGGMKSLMRQDPDVIFVGEIRDAETATTSVKAAMTGHQVFSTLHTNDAIGVIPRLLDMGLAAHMLAGSLICIVAQRLARRLCKNCKKLKTPTPEECKILGLKEDTKKKIYQHVGCEKCHKTGYKGRIALHEILAVDPGLDELIATGATRNHMLEHAKKNGFKTMADDGITKLLEGTTDLDELIRNVNMVDKL